MNQKKATKTRKEAMKAMPKNLMFNKVYYPTFFKGEGEMASNPIRNFIRNYRKEQV